MQVPVNLQTQEETNSRALRYKDTDHRILKVFLTLLVVGMAILISILYGEVLVSNLSPEQTYSSNQVEIISQEHAIINARLAEQRASIHSMEIRVADRNNINDKRFVELENKIELLEEQIQHFALHSQSKSHRVVRGDTLWRISMQYYGTAQYIKDLARYNNITNPRIIVTGTVITIPPISAFQ